MFRRARSRSILIPREPLAYKRTIPRHSVDPEVIMRRVRSCASFSLVAILCAGPTAAEEPADVLVLTDGATDAVAAEVEALGGLVRLRYQGVPALAARVPATRIPELRRREGVLAVEKDQVLALEDPLPPSRTERLRSLGREGLKLEAREARAFDPRPAPPPPPPPP